MSRDSISATAATTAVIGAVALILTTLASAASAQDALGDGSALDANPRVGSGGRNLPRVVEDFRARNRIVTGEVGDAREFRGEIDYVGERAFTAPLPSDDLFRFRADSAASSIQNVLSGVSYDRFNLGASGGVFAFDRDFTAPSAGTSALHHRAAIVPERVELDAAARASDFGRMLQRSAGSGMMGPIFDDRGDILAAIGGPVTGLRFETMPDGALPRTDLSVMDMRSLVTEFEAGVPGALSPGASFRSPLLDAGRTARETRDGDRESMAVDGRIDAGVDQSLREGAVVDGRAGRAMSDPDYDAIVRRIIEQYGTDSNVTFSGEGAMMRALQQELDALRGRLERPFDPEIPSIRDRIDAELAEPPVDAGDTRDGDAASETPTADEIARSDHLLRALRHGRTIDDLSPTERTRLGEMLSRGENLLAEGQYMLAEGYFDRALRMVPKHPMALAGLVNTQIGAGLYLSAAVNLNQLLAAHPEMIDTRYGERIMPTPDRIEIAIAALRRRTETADRVDSVDYGLLLAFIGHQMGNRDYVVDGLGAMRSTDPDSTLLHVLERVWLGE